MSEFRRDLLRTPKKEIPICEVQRSQDGHIILSFMRGAEREPVSFDEFVIQLIEKLQLFFYFCRDSIMNALQPQKHNNSSIRAES